MVLAAMESVLRAWDGTESALMALAVMESLVQRAWAGME
jgi:hypothetical protein